LRRKNKEFVERQFKKGHTPWNKGLRGKNFNQYQDTSGLMHKGQHHTPEMRARISKTTSYSMIGNHNFNREKFSKFREQQIIPFKDTSIERIVQKYLKDKQVCFERHKLFKLSNSCHRVDIYVPHLNLSIECDGNYWHSLPNVKERDAVINLELSRQCDLIRLPEDMIRSKDFENVLSSIL
jgi:very-short-patch-repair endonuclease